MRFVQQFRHRLFLSREPPSLPTKFSKAKSSFHASPATEGTVNFQSNSGADTGRIWWMYDRGPDGSKAYLREQFPKDQWEDMQRVGDEWTVEIELKDGASHIDFFCNHGNALNFKGQKYRTYISSPYARAVSK